MIWSQQKTIIQGRQNAIQSYKKQQYRAKKSNDTESKKAIIQSH